MKEIKPLDDLLDGLIDKCKKEKRHPSFVEFSDIFCNELVSRLEKEWQETAN